MDDGSPLPNFFAALILIIFVGTLGFHLIEKVSLVESFYLTITTITTLGNTPPPLTIAGKILSALLVLGGIGIVFIFARSIFRDFLFRKAGSIRSLMKRNPSLKNHVIVCGFGRIGKVVGRKLRKKKERFIAIDNDPERVKEARADGFNVFQGDAREEVLIKAGIKKAKSLVTCFKQDSTNVFITLTASSLNPDLRIISRSTDSAGRDKLEKAGAYLVVASDPFLSKFLAQAASAPGKGFIWDLPLAENLDVRKISIKEESNLAGKSISELIESERSGAHILAITRENESKVNPRGNVKIKPCDELLVVGSDEQLKSFSKLV